MDGPACASEPSFKAGVKDMHGPLADGELERAEEFGMDLAAKLSEQPQA